MKKKKRLGVMPGTIGYPKPVDYNTPTKKKRFVEDECQRLLEVVRNVNPDVDSFLNGSYGIRRQKAILNYMDRAEVEFENFGLTSVVESFAENELMPFNNYNHLDDECDLRIGAALWILDRLRASGKMYEAYKILPDTAGDIDAFYLQTDFFHPCYDNELIQSVIYVLSNRYGKCGIITEDNARGKEPDARYGALMDLMPKEDVEKACEVFKEKLWELTTRKLKGKACYDGALEQVMRQIQNANTAPLMNAPLKGPLANPTQKTDSMMGMPGLGGWNGMERPETTDLARRGKELVDQSHAYETGFDKYLLMDRKEARRETGRREVADAVAGFTVDDPYELCFALFYLIDNGDDAPWLIGSGSSLMLYAIRMFPWFMDEREMDDEEWDAWFDGMQYNQNGWVDKGPVPDQLDFYHEKHNGKNLAQVIYGLCRGVVPIGLHPFEEDRKKLIDEGMDEDKARKITDISDLIFLHAFQAKQYRPTGFDFDDEEELETFGSSDEEAYYAEPQPKTPVRVGGYWGKIAGAQNSENTVTESTSIEALEESQELKAELARAKKQIKELQHALSAEKHTADADRAKYERELRGLRMEHRELADLRSLVFNQENEVREEPTKGYEYPYETEKRTVIFGGHETWLKTIRPMFPTVKFVDASNLTFSPEIIRNAEVVWIQNNCISHSQFWSIVKNCKLAGVQMRYFGFASAEKCAEQLVTEDQK